MAVQQNNIAYITGSSKGIGKALTEKLIAEKYHVFGLSRTNDFVDSNFTFIPTDLSNLEQIKAFKFQDHESSNVLLVNNAGVLGDIGPIGGLNSDTIDEVQKINTIAPQILMNSFIKKYQNNNGNYHIINISSGAGKQAIDGWATYCSSKAALDLFSETIKIELKSRSLNNWHVHSVAPGIVDTAMQVQIRSADPTRFSSVQRFIDFKTNGDLFTSEWVAEKLFEIIKNPAKFPENLQSVRDY